MTGAISDNSPTFEKIKHKEYKLNPIDIILKYYRPGSKAFEMLVVHSRQVADKAIEIAEKLWHRTG
jgi:hypothetical protein